MPYIGQSMSLNAYNAYKKGLLPRTKISRKMLEEKGWEYSCSFFQWMCINKYIMPQEFHHTTPMKRITSFYDLNNIPFICDNFDLSSIYKVYRNQCSIKDILDCKGVSYVRILVGRELMKTKSDVYLDCIQYNRLFCWSKDKCFRMASKQILLIQSFHSSDTGDWKNPNKEQIERLIYIRKNYYKKPLG